jgi:tetratricopeptide (TPR) repeat protein
MLKNSRIKKIYGYFLFVCILGFLTFFHFQTNILNYVGEKIFLDYHFNNIAIFTLEKVSKKDFYTNFLLGRIYFVEGDQYKSITNYNLSIEKKSDFKQSYYGRGLTYGFMGSDFYPEAARDFQKYIDIDNQEFEKTGNHAYGAWAGYNDLAWIYFMQGEFEKSEKVSRDGLKIANSAWLLNTLGTTLLAQEKCDEGKIYLKLAKDEIQKISVEKFGEAYSGDNPNFWEAGKKQMEEAIVDNLKLCEEK